MYEALPPCSWPHRYAHSFTILPRSYWVVLPCSESYFVLQYLPFPIWGLTTFPKLHHPVLGLTCLKVELLLSVWSLHTLIRPPYPKGYPPPQGRITLPGDISLPGISKPSPWPRHPVQAFIFPLGIPSASSRISTFCSGLSSSYGPWLLYLKV